MADYPRRDAIRAQRDRHEQLRRLRTDRPMHGGAPVLSYFMEGQITFDRRFGPALITRDPLEQGYLAEHKEIIAVDGYLETGVCTVYWRHETDIFVAEHNISGGSNRIILPEPYIIENTTFGGSYPQPVILADPAVASYNLTCYLICQRVPL